MPTKFYNLDVDTTLGGNSPSDTAVSSQKAIKEYVDNKTLDSLSNVTISSPTTGQNLTYDATNQVWKNTSTSATVAWGGITGDITDQADLSNALGGKANINADNVTSTGKNTIVGWGLPDYSSGVTVSSGYTATTKCWFGCFAYASGNKNAAGDVHIYVNGVEVAVAYVSNWNYTERDRNFVPLDVGDVVTATTSLGEAHMSVFPMKGV